MRTALENKLDNISIDVVIPVYKPGEEFKGLLKGLQKQTCPVNKIIIINTEQQYFTAEYCMYSNMEIVHISKEEFDHAATRNMGMGLSDSEYVVFMTMDAIPYDEQLVEKLLEPHINSNGEVKIAVSYARQLPRDDCRLMEQYTRIFNYPDESMIKTSKDMDKLGIKTYFCSDVCAMYNRKTYYELGGFVPKAIFNEDMIYAAKAINSGYGIAYCAQAKVIHSHNYTIRQQFSRNFDMGVSQALHPEVFDGVASEGEGLRLVKNTAGFLLKNGHWYDVPYLIISSGAKYMGYRKGKRFKKLSPKKIYRYTMNSSYWNNYGECKNCD